MDLEGTLMSNSNVRHGGDAEWRKGQESSEVNYRNTSFSLGTVLCVLCSCIQLKVWNILPFWLRYGI